MFADCKARPIKQRHHGWFIAWAPWDKPEITILPSGYSPKAISVKAGSQVKLILKNNDAYTCAQAFTIPTLGIQRIVAPGQLAVIEFTAPSKPGKITFACSMGMYRGVINVL